MSSLRTLVRKGKVSLVCQETCGSEQSLPMDLAASFVRKILHHETIAIQAQNILESLIGCGDDLPEFNTLEDVTPPFRWTWVEGIVYGDSTGSSRRIGCLCQRNDAGSCVYTAQFQSDARKLGNLQSDGPYRHALLMLSFIENEGEMEGPLGMGGVLTNEYGEPQGWAMVPFFWGEGGNNAQALSLELISHCSGLAMEAFVWLNTQGTELVPEKSRCRERGAKKDVVPMSLWHTVVVGKPKSQSPIKQPGYVGEATVRREHWVRAHRADYRRGAGLFGRIKALIWVPEHKSGNHEIGTIIPTYKLGDP